MKNHSDFPIPSCNGACCRNAAAADDDDGDGVRPNQCQTQLLWKPWPTEALSMAKLALELTRQEWSRTGLGKMRLRAAVETTTPSASSTSTSTSIRPSGDGGATSSMNAATPSAGERGGGNDDGKRNDDESILKTIVDRIVALLLIRLVALVASRLGNNARLLGDNSNSNSNSNSICEDKDSACGRRRQRGKIYSDYSTTTICKSALQLSSLDDLDLEGYYCDNKEWERNSSSCNNSTYVINNKSHSTTIHNHHHHRNNDYNNNNSNINTFPSQITPTVIDQLQQYVTVICRQYPPSKDVPYHNVEHAYHVFISANKLLDLLLCEEEHTTTAATMMATEVTSTEASPIPPTATTTTANIESSSSSPHHHRPTFGLKSDPLSQFAYLFSALVHDVDHKGISNRQLVLEQDDLAILYNDQSVAEQRSLAVAFTTLKGVEYNSMREVLFPTRMRDGHGDVMLETSPRTPPITNVRGAGQESPSGQRTTTTTVNSKPLPRGADAASLGKNEHFLSFRKLVIDLVLVTDIASPERTQIVKSKWKEAFGHVVVAEKLRKRESASSAAAAAAAHSTGRSSEVTKSPRTTSTCGGGSGTDGPGGISSNDVVVSRIGSQTSSRLESGCGGQNSRRHSPFPDRQQNGIIALEQQQQQQSTPSTFLPSMDFSDKQTQQEVFMPQNVDFFTGDTMSSSTSSPSLSTIQSNEEDDFDASAVSRSKMNFNNNDSGGMPSPTLSYDSMEKLLEAAANYNVDDYDVTLRGDGGGGESTSRDDGCGRKHAKRSSYQHRKHPEEGDDNLDHNHGGEPLRWSTGDLSHGNNCDHQSRQHAPYPSTMILSRSMKTHNEMRYMPRRLHKLGVRRALDLAGSTVTAYNDNAVSLLSSLRVGGGPSSSSELREVHPHYQEADDIMRNEDGDFDPNDEVDEFKATVVLEQLMHAADVAALFQDWENVVEWSTRLYKELNNGYLSNRGDDPSLEWYENQMKFFDFYILPLAKNLAVMGVFDEGMGERIVHGVKSNMARWIREGNKAALKMKEDEERRMKGT